jgi:lipopolysaccharide/colanic/teichoic acid biosynthesis glycosyltransferase
MPLFSNGERRRGRAARQAVDAAHSSPAGAHGVLPEPTFLRALCLERKRAERSRKRFVLMVLELRAPVRSVNGDNPLAGAVSAIASSIRETDVAGWYRAHAALGVIFAELGNAETGAVLAALRSKMTAALQAVLPAAQLEQIKMTFHCFPDEWKLDEPGHPLATMYPDLAERDAATRVARAIKRGIDILGASAALLVLWPLLLVIAAAVKLTSPGPVFFRQTRVGQYGVPFTCLKFRSMHAVNDARIHQDYVKRFIAGRVDPAPGGTNGNATYKLTKDPRLTRIGAFLRKTSFDELPQFINVLAGQMSLVGPRPPIPYEFEVYEVWHRRRLLEVKPGITGLWQVNGRSRLRFDDMVRLDLRYAMTWSVWLDIKILLQTPYAVFSGEGAH